MRRVLTALLAAAITALCLWVLLTPQVLSALGRVRAEAKPAPVKQAIAPPVTSAKPAAKPDPKKPAPKKLVQSRPSR